MAFRAERDERERRTVDDADDLQGQRVRRRETRACVGAFLDDLPDRLLRRRPAEQSNGLAIDDDAEGSRLARRAVAPFRGLLEIAPAHELAPRDEANTER